MKESEIEPDRPPLNSVRAFQRLLLMSSHHCTFIHTHTHTQIHARTAHIHPLLHVRTKYTDMYAEHTHGHMGKADITSGIMTLSPACVPLLSQFSNTHRPAETHTFPSFLASKLFD